MPQNTSVGAVYNPKGVPSTLTTSSGNDWLLIQRNSDGRVGRIQLKNLVFSMTAEEEAEAKAAEETNAEEKTPKHSRRKGRDEDTDDE